MTIIGPALSRRAHLLVGEVAGAGVLLAALVITWSDGTPVDAGVDLLPPAPVVTAAVASYADPAHLRTAVLPPAPLPEAPVPTAAPAMIIIPSLNVHRPVEA